MTADLTTVKGGRLQVHMHPGQARAIQSRARHVLVLAGTQSGKTSFGPLWLFTEIKRCGPGDYLVVAPSFPLLELKLRPEFMRLFYKQLRLGEYTGSPTKKFTFSEAGSRKVFGDQYDPDKPTHGSGKLLLAGGNRGAIVAGGLKFRPPVVRRPSSFAAQFSRQIVGRERR